MTNFIMNSILVEEWQRKWSRYFSPNFFKKEIHRCIRKVGNSKRLPANPRDKAAHQPFSFWNQVKLFNVQRFNRLSVIKGGSGYATTTSRWTRMQLIRGMRRWWRRQRHAPTQRQSQRNRLAVASQHHETYLKRKWNSVETAWWPLEPHLGKRRRKGQIQHNLTRRKLQRTKTGAETSAILAKTHRAATEIPEKAVSGKRHSDDHYNHSRGRDNGEIRDDTLRRYRNTSEAIQGKKRRRGHQRNPLTRC